MCVCVCVCVCVEECRVYMCMRACVCRGVRVCAPSAFSLLQTSQFECECSSCSLLVAVRKRGWNRKSTAVNRAPSRLEKCA